ncbi:MAG: heavy-metal-associated domain-containing protein [Phycisphaerales bacterium]|nr:heavy-metal-associated domain-containing protein [Planctomycetota bacterium]MCH8509314.1 heavy-metal-associated domain-containing protein [Phycisphaerales bacterium]
MLRTSPAILLGIVATVLLAGCSTWDIDPLPPGERGPQVSRPPAPPPPPTSPGDQTPTPRPGETITLRVDGVDCPVCADMLAGRLRTVSGVSEARVVLRAGRVFITPTSGAAVAPASLEHIVTDAGFTYRGMVESP